MPKPSSDLPTISPPDNLSGFRYNFPPPRHIHSLSGSRGCSFATPALCMELWLARSCWQLQGPYSLPRFTMRQGALYMSEAWWRCVRGVRHAIYDHYGLHVSPKSQPNSQPLKYPSVEYTHVRSLILCPPLPVLFLFGSIASSGASAGRKCHFGTSPTRFYASGSYIEHVITIFDSI